MFWVKVHIVHDVSWCAWSPCAAGMSWFLVSSIFLLSSVVCYMEKGFITSLTDKNVKQWNSLDQCLWCQRFTPSTAPGVNLGAFPLQ